MPSPTPTRSDINVASHRRMVYRTIINALKAAFDGFYTREPEFTELHITPQYPLERIEYPAIVVEYQNTSVTNAGVGHAEWFDDPNGDLRRWNHSRFEGTLNFTCVALSPLDRDLLADALIEVLRFGKLDTQLIRFFNVVYPITDDVFEALHQIQLNTDEIRGSGDSASLAPWQPEDVLVYEAVYSMDIMGGYYNTFEQVDWKKLTHIEIDAYGEDSFGVKQERDHDHLDIAWNPPTDYFDGDVVTGKGMPSADITDSPRIYADSGKVKGHGHPSGSDDFTDN